MQRIAIMQPYFAPYIGYFHLIHSVDKFVVYDNIEFTRKGWINRNRFLANGQDKLFTLPLAKGSDYLDVRDRKLSDNHKKDFQKIVAQLENAYRKAPYFKEHFPVVRRLFEVEDTNLFHFIHRSLVILCEFMELKTEMVVSSTLSIDHTLTKQDKVLAMVHAMEGSIYINAAGGRELYNTEDFQKEGIELLFINSNPVEYPQFHSPFVPWLSIIDVLMFNSLPEIQAWLQAYELAP